MISYTLKGQLPGFTIVHTSFHLSTKLTNALIVYIYTLKFLLCTSTPLQDKFMTMPLLLHVIIIQKNIIELGPDSDDQDFYILGPEPIKRKPPLTFTPSQIKTTIRYNTFTAQDAGIYSNAELDQLWNRIVFSKHSDSTLQCLGKALSYSFILLIHQTMMQIHLTTVSIGLHDKIIYLTPLFTPRWYSDVFFALFGYPCYILTQC